MKNKWIKCASTFLGLIIVFTNVTAISGCKEQSEGNSSTNSDSSINSSSSSEPAVEYTDCVFVDNATSAYSIVIPKEYTDNELYAAHELNTILNMACGTTLEICYDDTVTWETGATYISVGQTKFLDELGITFPADMNVQGFVLKTVGKSVIISGATNSGTGSIYGVYEFLAQQVGYEYYGDNEIVVDKVTGTVNLIDVDVIDQPDISNYIMSLPSDSEQLLRRSCTQTRKDVLGESKITPYHNALDYLPVGTYLAEHKEWYNSQQTQLCYTAHGNAEEYECLVDTLFEVMLNEVLTYDLDIITFTMEDNYDYCICQACKDSEAYYGAKSGAHIKICNDLSDRFATYFAENDEDREITIMFFAYYFFTAAPSADKITCNDNVVPLIAPLNEMNRSKSIYDSANAGIYGVIENWRKICKRFGFWVYSANFPNYFVPVDYFSSMQENYQYFSQLNPVYFFDQGKSSMGGSEYSGFTNFALYLQSKLAWDVNADVEALTQKYFDNYFKAASTSMYEYYTAYRFHLAYLNETYGYTHNWGVDCVRTEYFPLGTLLQWSKSIDGALKAIEPLKDADATTYNTLYRRIKLESVSVQYLIIKLHSSYYSSSALEEMKETFFEDCAVAGVRSLGEYRDLYSAFTS